MKPPVVWFNKHLSNTWEILALLGRCCREGEFRLLCTHPRARYPGRGFSADFECEPHGLADDAYVEYCLDLAQRRHVDLFLPGRKVLPILRARDRFESLGVRLLTTADATTMAVLNNKGRVYAALRQLDVQLPDYEVVRDRASFEAAYDRLQARHALICYKPTVSVFGFGFRIVGERRSTAQAANPWFIELPRARHDLSSRKRFPELLIMQYLPGPEYSVDCLAHNGTLVRCVVRRKCEGGQMLEENPLMEAAARTITAHFNLTHLFNVQFRSTAGVPYLLEVNPRMSGGLPFACESGVALPYWALRLALGAATPADVPVPRTNVWVPQPAPARSA